MQGFPCLSADTDDTKVQLVNVKLNLMQPRLGKNTCPTGHYQT